MKFLQTHGGVLVISLPFAFGKMSGSQLGATLFPLPPGVCGKFGDICDCHTSGVLLASSGYDVKQQQKILSL